MLFFIGIFEVNKRKKEIADNSLQKLKELTTNNNIFSLYYYGIFYEKAQNYKKMKYYYLLTNDKYSNEPEFEIEAAISHLSPHASYTNGCSFLSKNNSQYFSKSLIVCSYGRRRNKTIATASK